MSDFVVMLSLGPVQGFIAAARRSRDLWSGSWLLSEISKAAAAEPAQGEILGCANDNGGGQVVISGQKSAVGLAIEVSKTKGVKRGMLLPVGAPFHCALMQPAAEAMRATLDKVAVRAPVVPVVANVLAAPISDPAEIKMRLVEEVTGRVRWTECVGWLVRDGGVTQLVELGAGKVLSGLAKRIAPETAADSVSTSADVDAFLAG